MHTAIEESLLFNTTHDTCEAVNKTREDIMCANYLAVASLYYGIDMNMEARDDSVTHSVA